MSIVFILLPIALVLLFASYTYFIKKKRIDYFVNGFLVVSLIYLVLVFATIEISKLIQQMDTEIWSGMIVDHTHKEEWDEWHPPRTETYTTTENGKTVTKTRIIPGYWEHHPAENYITTTDNGYMRVWETSAGTRLDDKFPNTVDELRLLFPLGTPTASTHIYKNKVQSSYSIFRYDDIDPKDYPDLPKYPKVYSTFKIDQFIGIDDGTEVVLNEMLMHKNTFLNKMIDDPEKPGKKRSWKQVNLILVNLKDKPVEYAYALQNKWENGNKNDFVVTFNLSNGKIDWAYAFSWSDSEEAKVASRDILLGLEDPSYVDILREVSKVVEEKFVRKQFADFEYIQTEVHPIARGIVIFLEVLYIVVFIMFFIGGLGVNIRFPRQSSKRW